MVNVSMPMPMLRCQYWDFQIAHLTYNKNVYCFKVALATFLLQSHTFLEFQVYAKIFFR